MSYPKRTMRPFAKGRARQQHQPGVMNRLEANYSLELEAQKRRGEILDWMFEAWKFKLANRTWYTPDFAVLTLDGTVELHETKGFLRDDANVKFKVAAELHWFKFKMVRRKSDQWCITDLLKNADDEVAPPCGILTKSP